MALEFLDEPAVPVAIGGLVFLDDAPATQPAGGLEFLDEPAPKEIPARPTLAAQPGDATMTPPAERSIADLRQADDAALHTPTIEEVMSPNYVPPARSAEDEARFQAEMELRARYPGMPDQNIRAMLAGHTFTGGVHVGASDIPVVPIPKPEAKGVASGVTRGALDMVEGLETPKNLMILAAAGELPAPVQKLVTLGFGADMMRAAPNEIEAALHAKTPGEAAEHWTRAVLSFVGGGTIAYHGAARPMGGGTTPTARASDARAANLEAAGMPRAAEAERAAAADSTETPPAAESESAPEAATPAEAPASTEAESRPEPQNLPSDETAPISEPAPAEAERPGPVGADAGNGDNGPAGGDEPLDTGDQPDGVEAGLTERATAGSGEPEPTSIKNAVVDGERSKRGLPPAMEPARRAFGAVWDEAMKRVEAEPGVTAALVNDLETNPRPMTDTEDALLLHRQIELQNEYDQLTARANEAISRGAEGEAADYNNRRAETLKELEKLYDVNKSVGTANARGLNARKMLANEDFTLAKMMAERRADKGRDLTPEETAQVQELHGKIKALQDDLAAREGGVREAQSDTAIIDAVRAMVARIEAERADEAARAEPEAPSPQSAEETADAPVADDQQAHLGGVPAVRVKADEIASRPDLMQFKRMDDAESGINADDKLTGKWDDRKAGLLLLWEPLDPAAYGLEAGQKYIVANGHHRLEFGRREGVREFNGQIVREADGISAQDARSLGAEINITDGKGTIYDQAKFLRNYAATHGADEALAAGGRIGARGRKAAQIAFSATDRLFAAFTNGRISPEHAAAIAEAAPRNEAAQAQGMRAALNGKGPEFAANRARAEMIRPADAPREFDLFGQEVFAEQDRQAEVATREQNRIAQELSAVRGAANRPELAAKHGVDVKDPEGVRKRIAELEAERERWKNWPSYPDLVAITRAEPVPVRAGAAETPKAPPVKAPTKRAEKKAWLQQKLEALDQRAEEARRRLEEKRRNPGAQAGPINPTDLDDYAIIGASHIARGAASFGRWAAKMVTEFGEVIRPHLDAIFARARELHRQMTSTRDLGAERERIVRAVKERTEDGDSIADLGRLARGLAENYVRRGVTEREPLIDAVHGELSQVMPDLTRRQTMDAISGYGDYKPLSTDAAKVKLRELKGEMQQIGKLQDMAEGIAPKKSGVQRRQVSDTERKLIKQVNEAKKKGGFIVTDPETQLRSAVQAIETRLANQLRDLTEEFALGKQQGERRVPPTSDRIEELRGMISRVKESLRGVRESKGRTPEEQIKAAMDATQRSLAEYERRLKEDDFAPKQKGARPTSPELEALRARRDQVRQEYHELRELDEAVQQQKAERRTRGLQDQIAELDRKMREGDIAAGEKPAPMLTPEQEDLVMQRDAMLKEISELRRGPRKTDAERQVERLLEQVNETERRLREGDLGSRGKKAMPPLSPEAENLMMQRDALSAALREQQAALRPRKTDAEIALQRWKTNALKQEADLRDRMARGDFSPKAARQAVKLDVEGEGIRLNLERLKLDYRRAREKDRLANRTWSERALEGLAKWRRAFVLSGPVTLAKLTSSAFEIGSFTPLEEVAGGAIGKVIPGVAKRAPRQGGLNWRAEAEAVGQTFTRLFSDIGHTLKTGHMDIDLLYGKPDVAPRELKDFVGAVHGALKALARRNEFTRSFRKRIDWKAENGVDVNDPAIQLQTAVQAYKNANESIFSEDSRVVSAYKAALASLGKADPITGKTPIIAKGAQTALRFIFPVVKIPTNIVARTMEYSLGTVMGSARLARAVVKGLDNLHPDEADLIMRNLKRGSLGATLLLVGFFNPQNVGGYYQRGQKRDDDDVKAGGLRIGGWDVPRYLVHNPLLEQLQIGATIRRVADSKLRKRDLEKQGVTAGIEAALFGLVEEVPFVRETGEVAKALNPQDRAEFKGRLASSVVPEGVRATAEYFDRDAAGNVIKRKPESAADYVMQAIPGFRQQVRTKEEADKARRRR